MNTRSSVILANSFSYTEVCALLEMHEAVLSGEFVDARQYAHSPELGKVIQKFTRMRAKYDRVRMDDPT